MKAAPSLPTSPIGLGILLSQVLTAEELDVLDQLEAASGEVEANAWLCSVLVETGRYTSDGGVFVVPQEDLR